MQSVSKLSKNMPESNIMIEPNNSIISLKIWYNGVLSCLFQNTIICIQVALFDMHHYSHVLPTDFNPYSANLAGVHDRSHVPSQSFSKVHGINPVRCNKSFGSWCTRRKTSHLNQSLILQNSHTFHSIVTLHNLSFQPVILDGHRR